MNENFTNSDLLIQYLDGELEGDQLISVSREIEADKNLAAELESLRLTRAAVKSYALKKNIASVHTEMMKELQHQTPARVINMKKGLSYSLRIAAMLILIAGVGLLYQYLTATPEKLFHNNFELYQLNEVRGNVTSNPVQTAYKNGNLQEVMNAFKQLQNPQPLDYFLEANAALRLNDAPTAITSLEKLQQTNNTNNTHLFEDDTDYFLGLAYLGNNQPQKALPLFEKIHSDKDHPYYPKISAWFMQKLRRLVK